MPNRVFAALFGLMFGAWPARALGAELEPAGEAAARVVEITVVGTNEELERIRAALAPGDLVAADVRWSRADRFDRDALLAREPNAPGVRAFVVLSPRRAELFFADRAAERFLVRELTLVNGLDSVGSDAVSQVLALSLAALADNAESGLTRAQTEKLLAPEPAPLAPAPAVVAVEAVDAPAARPAGRSFVGATAFYAARVFGGGAPLEHGPGVRIGWITETPRVEGELWISAQYGFPLHYQTETVGVDWTTALLRGGLALMFLPKRDSLTRFGVALGAGADLLNFTPRAGTAPADLSLASPGQISVFALSLRIVASVRLGSHLDGSAELFSDVYPTRVSYALSTEAQAVNVLTPWRIRPGFALSLTLR